MSPFNLKLPIALGCDHAGFDCKEDLISFLEGEGVAFKDFGTYSKDSVDYPDFAHPVASAVEKGEAAFGVLLCGSANGVAITANKHQGIRAAICCSVSPTYLLIRSLACLMISGFSSAAAMCSPSAVLPVPGAP